MIKYYRIEELWQTYKTLSMMWMTPFDAGRSGTIILAVPPADTTSIKVELSSDWGPGRASELTYLVEQ